MGAVRGLRALVCLVCVMITWQVRGEIRPAATVVAGVPGGVVAVPLMRSADEPWPAAVPVRVGEYATRGQVVWVGSRDDGQRYWTRSPDQVDVRPVGMAPEGAPPEQTGVVLALIELPVFIAPLEVAGRPIEVNWLQRTPLSLGNATPMPWPASPANTLPDVDTPSEYWRWCLLAQRNSRNPPPPRGTMPEQLWARHVAGLWLGGLERVRRASAGVHAELVEALTNTVTDPLLPPPGQVAGWIANPDDLRALLTVLLDSSTRPEQVAQSALTWLRTHWMVTMWVEADAGDRVLVAAANGTAAEQVLQLTWIGAHDAVPVAVLLPPRTLVRQWVDRAPLPGSRDAVPVDRLTGEHLQASIGDMRRIIPVGPREYAVRPPGLSFGALMPPLSLADAQRGRIEMIVPEWRTTAQLRRRQSRWEVLVECMRPANADALESEDEVTVAIGHPEDPVRLVRVSADARFEVDGGASNGAGAGFLRWPDRWRARIELPDAWIPASTAGMPGMADVRPFMISIERNTGFGRPRQTGALAVPAWTRTAPPVLVDLGTWTDPVTAN